MHTDTLVLFVLVFRYLSLRFLHTTQCNRGERNISFAEINSKLHSKQYSLDFLWPEETVPLKTVKNSGIVEPGMYESFNIPDL